MRQADNCLTGFRNPTAANADLILTVSFRNRDSRAFDFNLIPVTVFITIGEVAGPSMTG